MRFVNDDGGRANEGYSGSTGDCVTRSIAIATGRPNQEVYDALNALSSRERIGKRKKKISNARTGVYKNTYRPFMESIGWEWVPTMHIGSGCKVHLLDGELPTGKLVVSLSRHMTCVIDGVIHDTYDPQREIAVFEPDHGQELKANQGRNQNGIYTIQRRCVYGYFRQVSQCHCELSDAWRCAVKKRLRSVSCPCVCHKETV